MLLPVLLLQLQREILHTVAVIYLVVVFNNTAVANVNVAAVAVDNDATVAVIIVATVLANVAAVASILSTCILL